MSDSDTQTNKHSRDFLTVVIAGQRFGIPVLQVQDVLREQRVTKIPLAPPEIAGSLNLRGRIVTAIDVRKRLGLPPIENKESSMSVVVEHTNDLFSLIIDEVGDVLSLELAKIEKTPTTIDSIWREISTGVHQLKGELLIIMDVSKLLDYSIEAA